LALRELHVAIGGGMPNITPARRAPSASIKLAELDGAIVAWPVPKAV
jgi:hypothetical protein